MLTGRLLAKAKTSITLVAAIILLGGGTASAQDFSSTQFDHGVPPEHVAGVSQIGSYISDEIGTINLSNGSLNFKIPMGAVGGRGFWLPITLNYNNKLWTAGTGTAFILDAPAPGKHVPAVFANYDDPARTADIYDRIAAGWTIGATPILAVRGVGISPVHNPSTGGTNYPGGVLVKLTLTLPDKGTVEFRDDQTDGAPQSPVADRFTGSLDQDQSRGSTWHATDGSGMIFINDLTNGGIINGDLTGTLITADGLRYVFQNGSNFAQVPSVQLNNIARCTSITDRNGNMIAIGYHAFNVPRPTRTITFTDQLGRQTVITETTNLSAGASALTVTLPAYNGQTSTYTVMLDWMGNRFLPGSHYALPIFNGLLDPENGDQNTGSGTALFPNSFSGGYTEIDNTLVVSELILPDNRALNFYYNEHGEVGQVTLPTGGVIKYQYASIVPTPQVSGPALPAGNSLTLEVFQHPQAGGSATEVKAIDRAVVAKQTLPDGVTQQGSWTYTYTGISSTGGFTTTGGVTEVKCTDASLGLVLDEKHYFLDAQQFQSTQVGGTLTGTGYSLWSTGVERRSEKLNSSGQVLLAGEQDWTQRAQVSWTTQTAQQIQNDNRVNESRRILDDGSIAKTDTFYDSDNSNIRANNVTEVKEYDFDQATVLRDTVTAYLHDSSYTGQNSVHLLDLVSSKQIKNGGGSVIASTTNIYDTYTPDPPSNNHAALVSRSGATGVDPTFAGGTLRGNPTDVTQLGGPNGSITTYHRYDALGNMVSATDPNGFVWTYDFTDDFGLGLAPGSGSAGPNGTTFAMETRVSSPKLANGTQQSANSQFDFNTGLLTGFKDRNGIITQTLYNDPFDRPTEVLAALGNSTEAHTSMFYAPGAAHGITLTNEDAMTVRDQNGRDDQALRSWVKTDAFGR